MELKHFSKTVVGLVRKANEDHIGSLTNQQTNGNGDVFVVCDGMGGHVGGATASKKAVECILEYFKNETHPNPILALEKAISFANEQIYVLSQDNPELKGMGTTCTALLQKNDNIYIAHVGDSRIYLNTDSLLYRITKDHSFVQKLVDAGQLSDSEMETHPRKNELTRALGISIEVEVEVSEKPLIVKNGDKFLMCSDGLCGLVNDPTILNTINKEKGFGAVEELIQLALNAGGNDNISVDIIEVVNSPHLKTVFKDQTNTNNSNLSQTQVFDASTFKKDRNLVYTLNRYKYYILSFILLVILGVYLVSRDFLEINQSNNSDSSGNLKEENKIISVKDSINIDSSDNSSSAQIIKNSQENYNDVEKEEYSVIAKSESNARAEATERKRSAAIAKAEAAESKRLDSIAKARIEEKKRKSKSNSIKILLKEAKDFIKIIDTKTQNFKGKKGGVSFINFDIAFNALKKSVKNKKTDNLKQEMDVLDSKWNKIELNYDQNQSNIIKAAIEKGKKILNELEKIIKINKVYEDYVKIEIKELNDSFEGNNISIVNNKYEELKKQKIELENRISIEKKDYIQFKRYLWDLNNCGTEKQSHYGKGVMYAYKQDDKEINQIYLKEKKEINSFKDKGYELSNEKENTLKKEDIPYKVFFTKKTFNNKALFTRFSECNSEIRNQIYVLKKIN